MILNSITMKNILIANQITLFFSSLKKFRYKRHRFIIAFSRLKEILKAFTKLHLRQNASALMVFAEIV